MTSDPAGGRLPRLCVHQLPARDCPDCYSETGGVWVHRHQDESARHQCAPPTRGVHPGAILVQGRQPTFADLLPDGAVGDRWRCGCGQMWRVGPRCDACDPDPDRMHRGQCSVGIQWRPVPRWPRKEAIAAVLIAVLLVAVLVVLT